MKPLWKMSEGLQTFFYKVFKIQGRYIIIHLSLEFGRSDLAAVWFDLIESIIKEPGSFIHDSFLFSLG